MTDPFSDSRVVEALARAMANAYGECYEWWHLEHARVIATKALAALSREELIEKALTAIERPGNFTARVPQPERESFEMWRARAVVVALGLDAAASFSEDVP